MLWVLIVILTELVHSLFLLLYWDIWWVSQASTIMRCGSFCFVFDCGHNALVGNLGWSLFFLLLYFVFYWFLHLFSKKPIWFLFLICFSLLLWTPSCLPNRWLWRVNISMTVLYRGSGSHHNLARSYILDCYWAIWIGLRGNCNRAVDQWLIRGRVTILLELQVKEKL